MYKFVAILGLLAIASACITTADYRWDVYHTNEEMADMLSALQRDYPWIVKLTTFGKSVNGTDLYAIRITDFPLWENEQGEPQVLMAANMHGYEASGREILLKWAITLCQNYGKLTPQGIYLTKLVNSLDLWIIPSLNPDGFAHAPNWTDRNANRININRNFPDHFKGNTDSEDGRQPETIAMMRFIKAHKFVLGAMYHEGATVANYPYDGWSGSERYEIYSAAPDDSALKMEASIYATNHTDMWASEYFPGGIVNGAYWYVVFGGLQDYAYVWHGVHFVTLEILSPEWLPASELPTHWEKNFKAFTGFISIPTWMGVRGTVWDLATFRPLHANIDIEGINKTYTTNPATGDYFRLLAPGTYKLTASYEGYYSRTVTFTIPEGQTEPVVKPIGLLKKLF